MKNLLLILSLSLLLLACKKEDADYRDKVVGSYHGRAYFENLGANTHWWNEDVTVFVTKNNIQDSILVFKGDILNYGGTNDLYYDVKFGHNSVITGGKFINDSLIFTMHDMHQYVSGTYYLKKQ